MRRSLVHWFSIAGIGCSVLMGCSPLPKATEIDDAHKLVLLQSFIPDIEQDIRYAGSNNFLGRPVVGYDAAQCWLSRPAVHALVGVQKTLEMRGLALKVFDCYRPQAAVDDFVQWGQDLQDQAQKPDYYPDVPKSELFARGYIAEKSGHSRASTVDLTLIVTRPELARTVLQGDLVQGQEVPMGTPFDWFGEASHTDSRAQPLPIQHNRRWLKTVMERHGWINLPEEWWHYTLKYEPYPQTYFNLPVLGKPQSP